MFPEAPTVSAAVQENGACHFKKMAAPAADLGEPFHGAGDLVL
jgi:hypothetical protein